MAQPWNFRTKMVSAPPLEMACKPQKTEKRKKRLRPRSRSLAKTEGSSGLHPSLYGRSIRLRSPSHLLAERRRKGRSNNGNGRSSSWLRHIHAPGGLLLRDREAVHLHLKEVIDAEAIDAVGLRRRPRLRHRVDDRAVDDEINFVAHHAHFERVGALSTGVALL